MAQQRMMLLPLLSAVLSVILAAKRPVTDRVRSSHVTTHPRNRTGNHSRSREAGRHRRLASEYISCMLLRYHLRCISSTNVSPLAMEFKDIQTHFLPSTGYCTTALATIMYTCTANVLQQAFRARSPSPVVSVALMVLV
jgi:hypothetical protein